MNLQRRTREQLLEDFSGDTQPNLKLLNLIHSLFAAISEAGGEVTWDDITGKPNVVLRVNGVTADANGAVVVGAPAVEITPIEGLAASTVQEALEELAARG